MCIDVEGLKILSISHNWNIYKQSKRNRIIKGRYERSSLRVFITKANLHQNDPHK